MNRQIDSLGRIVIPMEMRKALRIKEGMLLSFELQNDSIVIKNTNKINIEEYIYDLLEKEEDKHTREVLTNLLNQMEE